MIRRLSLTLCALAVAVGTIPAAARADDSGWSVSTSGDLVSASFLSTTASDARLSLENNVSFKPFGLQAGNEILDALGFGGGYSQEATWKAGAGPTARCPELLVDFPFTCSSDDRGNGTVLIPDGLRAELNLTAPVSAGSTTLLVLPDQTSRDYDGAIAAIGIALETINPGPIGSGATQVAALALQLLPEAAGFGNAIGRGDTVAAFNELVSLSKRALKIIEDHAVQWGVGTLVDFIPGPLEIKIGLACAKAIVALANLDAHLLTGNAVSTVTVTYAGSQAGPPGPTPTPTPTATPAPNAGTFSPTGSMITGRIGQTATSLTNGQVLLVGGLTIAGVPDLESISAELYDPKTGTFRATAPMVEAREFHTATPLADGRVLIAGGMVGPDMEPSTSAEIYDPVANAFTATGSMTAVRWDHTATLLHDGRVLIAGGSGVQASPELSSAETYDPATGTFSPTGSMLGPAQTATTLADGRVLLAGVGAAAQLYDPAHGTFSLTGSMATARVNYTATLLDGGQVLFAGGEMPGGGSSAVLNSAEVYDPATGAFRTTGSLSIARAVHTATLLANGRVLIAGGDNGQTITAGLTSAELYDPSTGVFREAGSMAFGRWAQTATLLADGRVLIAGGGAGSSSAELYQP